MVWVLVSVLGFGLEVAVIVVLGRQVTGPYEAQHAADPPPPVDPAPLPAAPPEWRPGQVRGTAPPPGRTEPARTPARAGWPAVRPAVTTAASLPAGIPPR
ncbi:hypothetical protein [Geodermatophilus sp. SYSU D00815]